MGHTDRRTSALDRQVLVEAGMEPGLIAKLQEIRPSSVASMALLQRSSALADAKGQLPKGEGDITATEDEIMAALTTVFVAHALQQREIDARYGPLENVVVIKHDGVDGRTDLEVQTNGSGNGGSNGKRPQTVTMMILRQLLRKDGFRSFFQSRMARPIQGCNGRRVVNLVKEEAARIAEITQAAAGAA